MAAEREGSAGLAPALSAGVEECWMEMDGGRMRYLRTLSKISHLAKEARCGAPQLWDEATQDRSLPALILLHGLLGYSFSWRYTMPAVAPYATVYAPDMLGSGFSDRAFALDYSMRACARRVVRFAEQLRLPSVDLLGTSHGGGVAMMAADEFLAAASRVKLNSLVLVAPVNPYSSHGKKLAPFLGTRLGT